MRTSRSTPRVVARIGRSIYRLCTGFSVAVLALGSVILVLELLRDERVGMLVGSPRSGPALLIVEALLLAVAALSWLIGRAIKYLTSSRSAWLWGTRWTAAWRDQGTRFGPFTEPHSRAGFDQAPGGFSPRTIQESTPAARWRS